MKKQILKVKGAAILTKKEQTRISGARAIGFCTEGSPCPPGSSCIGDICFTNGNDGNPVGGGGCIEPIRICEFPETGCGCIY